MSDNNTRIKYGLIPAAGKGVRARPYTNEIHKGMLDINGVPNIERIIHLMRDSLGVEEVIIVVGHLGQSIQDHFHNGKQHGVNITYVENAALDKGWAWSVLLAQSYIDDTFCIMLCDESYISSNHQDLVTACAGMGTTNNSLAMCAGMHVDDEALIKKNYAIEQYEGKVIKLEEKPSILKNDVMGSGTFVCCKKILPLLNEAFKQVNDVHFIDFLNNQITAGNSVDFFELKGTYVNINDRDSLHLAKYHDRSKHFSQYKSSLLICSEGNESNIAFTIKRYQETQLFNEIVVVCPQENSIGPQVQECQVTLLTCAENIQDFGARVHFGLSQLQGDILVMTEAAYSFPGRDVDKLFTYLKEADMVIGTRTTRQLIEQGSTMQGVVRIAHAALGFLLELLWWKKEGRFTDVGCTFRALWKSSYQIIDKQLHSTGPEFLAEMVIAELNTNQRVLEVPVNYFNRSESQNRSYRNTMTFFRVFWFIIKRRFTG